MKVQKEEIQAELKRSKELDNSNPSATAANNNSSDSLNGNNSNAAARIDVSCAHLRKFKEQLWQERASLETQHQALELLRDKPEHRGAYLENLVLAARLDEQISAVDVAIEYKNMVKCGRAIDYRYK